MSIEMRDEDFEIFIEEMGEATSRVQASISSIEAYRGKLPDVLLGYWASEGFACYKNGLFQLVNPQNYEELLVSWLRGTIFEKNDVYHVFGVTAFGELYAWGERLNRRIVIDTLLTSIVCDLSKYDKPSENPNLAMQSFFAMSDPEAFDFEDSAGDYLFGLFPNHSGFSENSG